MIRKTIDNFRTFVSERVVPHAVVFIIFEPPF